ncbi:MAG: hypothetical protein PHS24_02545 [Bacilli bacterium]|nr:hypothetical protein [Bacilli bacterium]
MDLNISDKKIFEILIHDKVFFKIYLKDYFKRYHINNNDIDLVTEAFLKFHNNKIIDIKDLIELGDYINFNFKVFGLRSFNYPLNEKETHLSEDFSFIYRKLQTLLNCYYGFWSEIEVLEKEAYFHIQLMRIIPFACNNELICQLILISNLIKENINPFIMEKNDLVVYKKCIRTSDALKFKNIIGKNSKEELEKMVNLYKKFYQLPEDKDIKDIILLKV